MLAADQQVLFSLALEMEVLSTQHARAPGQDPLLHDTASTGGGEVMTTAQLTLKVIRVKLLVRRLLAERALNRLVRRAIEWLEPTTRPPV